MWQEAVVLVGLVVVAIVGFRRIRRPKASARFPEVPGPSSSGHLRRP